MGAWQILSGQIGLEVARIILVIQPRAGQCQFLHCVCWMNHCLVRAYCGLAAQEPRQLSLREQGHPQHHDFHIVLSWCVFCGTFQW